MGLEDIIKSNRKKREESAKRKSESENINIPGSTGDSNNLESLVKDFHTVKMELKALEAREKELKKDINALVDSEIPTDGLGNRFYHASDISGNSIVLKREIRKSTSLDMEGLKVYLKDNNLWEKVATVNVSLSQEKLLDLVKSGEIPPSVIQDFTNVNASYVTRFVTAKDLEDYPEC